MIVTHELNQQLDQFIQANEESLIRETIQLVAIPSLKAPATEKYPFGPACAQALDHALALADSYGFPTENQDYYYGSCLLKGSEGKKELALVCHLDIVPATEDNWKRPPFEGYVENGYIVGRGSTDNKGPTIAALYVLRFLKEQGITLKNDLRLIFGCDEESGSADMVYYAEHAPRLPAFALVPDGPFPICYAEKGRCECTASIDLGGKTLLRFSAGDVANTTPGRATADLAGITLEAAKAALPADKLKLEPMEGFLRVTATGLSKHTSTPEGAIDAAHALAAALAASGLLDAPAQAAMAGLAAFSSDYYGQGLGIAFEDDILGKLTHSCSVVRTEGTRLVVSCDIRYPVLALWETLRDNLRSTLGKAGYSLDAFSNNAPNYMPTDTPEVQQLCAIANEQMGISLPPATMGGGTYARKLPRAVAYGPSRPDLVKPFPPGHGWAHQVDEGVRIANLTDQIRVYVPALMYLDEIV